MRAKSLFLYFIIYSFIAIIMGLLIVNAENLGLLGTNTMESSCHYSQASYFNTIWEGNPCGFTLESLLVLWISIMIFPIIGTIISSKIKKGTWGPIKTNFIKWFFISMVILLMTAFDYWQGGVLTIITFYKLILGTVIFLSPFLILSFVLSLFHIAKN